MVIAIKSRFSYLSYRHPFFSGGAQPTHVKSMLHSKDKPEEQ